MLVHPTSLNAHGLRICSRLLFENTKHAPTYNVEEKKSNKVYICKLVYQSYAFLTMVNHVWKILNSKKFHHKCESLSDKEKLCIYFEESSIKDFETDFFMRKAGYFNIR